MTTTPKPSPTTVIAQLSEQKFYGKLTLSFEAGRVTTMRKEEVIKLTDDKKQK